MNRIFWKSGGIGSSALSFRRTIRSKKTKNLAFMNTEGYAIDRSIYCTNDSRSIDQYPYIAPFQYAFLDGTIYFHFSAYGRKMKLLKKQKKVCVEIEQYEPDMSRYMFVTLKGTLSIVTDSDERRKAIETMRCTGKQRLSRNFLAAHGFPVNEDWSSLTHEKPLIISKLAAVTKSGLKSP